MKILAPLSQIENYEPLVEAGADELFAGIFPYEWVEKYSSVFPINRREYIFGNCNISSTDSLKSLSKLVDKYDKNIKIAFNSHYFLKEQYSMLEEVFRRLIDLGFDTFIISDIALITYLRERGLKFNLHLSGELQVLNEYSLKFLEQFDVSRLVFPRRARIKDMKDTIKYGGLIEREYEAFMMNSFCPFDGAFCNSLHCDELQHICWINGYMNTYNDESKHFSNIYNDELKKKQSMQYHDTTGEGGCEGCGLCAIKDLKEIGITNLKVVGRGVDLQDIIRDVSMVRHVLDKSDEIENKDEFKKYVQNKYFNGDCSNRLCYYPE